jgi:hypothetical protein
MKYGIYLSAFVVVVALSVGMFYVKRSWNYYWGYENETVETICEMVKPEYLVDEDKCA